MSYPLRLALPVALLLVQSVAAQTQTLPMPAGAVQIGTRTQTPSRYALPVAAFDGSSVPTRIVTGGMQQQAWRVDGLKGNTLSLLQPLSDQLAAQGYQVIFTCETTLCGGFDFRFGIDILPEPQMHVDLGDFRFLAAQNAAGDAVSLLVSRTADQGFVQVTSVTAAGHAPSLLPAVPETTPPADVATAATLPTPPPDAPPPDEQTPDGPPPEQPPLVAPAQPDPQVAPQSPPDPGDFASQLTATGSVALDDLVFASGKSALQDQDYASLAALAAWLHDHPGTKVTLVGHTDASGTLAGNVALSRQRAASVRDWLVQHYQASAAQIDAQGAGYLSPRATNQTPEGRTLNRRVEVMLTSLPAR